MSYIALVYTTHTAGAHTAALVFFTIEILHHKVAAEVQKAQHSCGSPSHGEY